MTRQEAAVRRFDEGLDCSRAVFHVFTPLIQLDDEHRKQYSSRDTWTPGMPQKWCGAVTGAYNVIELCCAGSGRLNCVETLCETFTAEFRKRNRSIICTTLLGFDLSNLQDVMKIIENGSCDGLCRKLITDAVEILEEILLPMPGEATAAGGAA